MFIVPLIIRGGHVYCSPYYEGVGHVYCSPYYEGVGHVPLIMRGWVMFIVPPYY